MRGMMRVVFPCRKTLNKRLIYGEETRYEQGKDDGRRERLHTGVS